MYLTLTMPVSARGAARLLFPVVLLAFALLVPGPGQAKLEKREWLDEGFAE